MRTPTLNEERFLEKTIRRVGKAINTYDLIREGDRIAVALSGGKDSMVMLETLALRKKHLPIDYSLTAIHVDIVEIPYLADNDILADLCAKLDVPLIHKTLSIDIENSKESICFLCSRARRKELFETALDRGCRKIALGHHMEDALETLLLNMTYNGAISSMPPKLSMFNGDIEIIRPLIQLTERDIQYYARVRNFMGELSKCPHAEDTKRHDIKKIINELQSLHKHAKQSMFKSMSNIHEQYLPPHKKKKEKPPAG